MKVLTALRWAGCTALIICTVTSVFSLLFPRQPKLTPQLTPRRPPALAEHRSSILFESCETISITSLGKTHRAAVTPARATHSFNSFSQAACLLLFFLAGSEEDLFYDAPSSPVGDRPFFPDNPVSLRSVSKMKSYVKEDAPKNMKDLVMTFEISEVTQLTFYNIILLFFLLSFCSSNTCLCLYVCLCVVFCAAVSPVWGPGGDGATPGHRGSRHRAQTAHFWHDI